jgi:hypothetical protein
MNQTKPHNLNTALVVLKTLLTEVSPSIFAGSRLSKAKLKEEKSALSTYSEFQGFRS